MKSYSATLALHFELFLVLFCGQPLMNDDFSLSDKDAVRSFMVQTPAQIYETTDVDRDAFFGITSQVPT